MINFLSSSRCRRVTLILSLLLALLVLLQPQQTFAASEVRVFVVNGGSDTVSVISDTTNTVIATIPVGNMPWRIAITPNGSKAYVVNAGSDDVSVISISTNSVITTIPIGAGASPQGVCITPDGTRAYVANRGGNSYSAINTLTDTLVTTVPLGLPIGPLGVGCSSDNGEFWIGGGGGGAAGDITLTFTHPGLAPAGTVSGTLGSDQIKFLPDNTSAYILNGCGSCGDIQHVLVASKTIVGSYGFSGPGSSVAVAPDGSAVYAVGGYSKQLIRFNPFLGVVASASFPASTSSGLEVTPDGNFLYLSNGLSPVGQLLKVNASTLAVVATIPVGASPFGLAITTVTSVDTTPPSVNVSFPSPDGLNGWFVSPVVTGSVTAVDSESNIASLSCTGASLSGLTGLGTSSASGILSISTDGIHSVNCFADDSASNTGSDSETVMVDSTSPAVTCSSPPTYTLYQSGATVSASVSDATSGPTASTVSQVVSTASVGTYSASLTGSDNAGNSTTVACSYNVVYNFTGFFQPVDNLPTLNSVKAGSAVPIKFSLDGNQGLNIFSAGYPTSTSTTCGTTAVDAIEETLTAGSSSLAYDATSDQYTYVWKTGKAWAGTCRTLVVKLNDGTYHKANFQFK